jgi:hypothetical protein
MADRRWRSLVSLSPIVVLVVASAACSSTKATNTPSGQPKRGTSTSATSAPTSLAPTTTTAAPTFSAIAGSYVAGTADGGSLFVRADGASRFSAPDSIACPSCSTASTPIGTVDFGLTTLQPTGGGAYTASGTITAESDPAWANQLGAGPVGHAVTLTVSASGSITVSFLPANDTLNKSGG